MNIEYLFTVKESILKGKSIYIWGTGENSKKLFLKLLIRGIHISGFVTNQKNKAGICLFARTVVYSTDEKLTRKFAHIVIPKGVQPSKTTKKVIKEEEIWEINEKLLNENINIWGAGEIGREIVNFLTEKNENIKIYDSDKNKIGKSIRKYVIEDVKELRNTQFVILATYDRVEDMLDLAKNMSIENVFLANEVMREKIFFKGKNKCVLNYRSCFYEILRDAKEKKCFIYRNTESGSSFQYEKFLTELGLDIQSISGNQIYDLLYEQSRILILLDGNNLGNVTKKIEDLGFLFGRDYNFLNAYRSDIFYKQKMGLDVNLGYTKFDNLLYPGIAVFGKESEGDIRILTIGGSTTDASLYPFKSWSECLYEKLLDRGIEATVFCGGVNGYQVSQEFLQLVRDGIQLKPDVVISYSGLNNLDVDDAYPFYQQYQLQLFEHLKTKSPMNGFEGVNKQNLLGKGIKTVESAYHFWERIQKYMKTCCDIENIRYYGILQPNMLNKESYSLYEQEIAVNFEWCQEVDRIEKSKQFRTSMLKKENGLYNLSDIFDNEPEIYIDGGHVWEKGNSIIAEAVLEIINIDNFILEKSGNV